MARAAVIDIGTNTFHALAVQFDPDGQWQILYKERIFVNLAEDGIQQIGDAAWHRGHQAIENFCRKMENLSVDKVRAVGTAALRTAHNAGDFIDSIRRNCDIHIEVISGESEARYIARGVMKALPVVSVPILILDIGGGSIELILVDEGKIILAESFPLGIAVLYDNFHHSEPMSGKEHATMEAALENHLGKLLKVSREYPGLHLCGAAGTFEVLESSLSPDAINKDYSLFDKASFYPVYQGIVSASLDERRKMPEIPESRARYIVVAFALIRFFLDRLPADSFYISNFALKEGVLCEMEKDQL